MPGSVILMASANQELINTILKIRDDQLSKDTTIGPLSKFGGSIQLDLSVTVSGFQLSIAGGVGKGTATVTPTASVTYKIPGGDLTKKAVDVSIKPPAINVVLVPDSSKAEIYFALKTLEIDLSVRSWLPDLLKGLWDKLLELVESAVMALTDKINDELAKHPTDLFDLSKDIEVPLGDGKQLPMNGVFNQLKFEEEELTAKVTMNAKTIIATT